MNQSSNKTIETIVSSHDCSILVVSDQEKVGDYLLNDLMPKSQIPDFKIGKNDEPTWKLTFHDKIPIGITYDETRKEIEINGKFQTDTSQHDLTFLLLTLFSKEHEMRGRIMFHASAVSDGDKIALFLGERGMGKSILATELIYKRNFKLVSGENVLIYDGQIIAGTPVVSNRAPVIAKYYPELIDKDLMNQRHNYEHKFWLPKSIIGSPAELPQKIERIYFINVRDSQLGMVVSQPHKSSINYSLLYNCGAYSSGFGRTIMNFTQPQKSFDTEELKMQRLKIVDQLMALNIEQLTGSLDDVAGKVFNNFNGEC